MAPPLLLALCIIALPSLLAQQYQAGPNVDCVFEWGDWSQCDKTCGGGHQIRKIGKIIKESLGYGLKCPILNKIERQPCNLQPCPTTAAPTTIPPPTIPTTTIAPPSGTPPGAIMCNMLADGNYPSGKCSHLYYICVGGTLLSAECQVGLIYDPDLDRCDVAENTLTCTGTSPTTIVSPPSATFSTPAPEFDCHKQKDGDYPSPNSKCESKFYTCSGGHTFIRYCAHGLFFDPEILICESWYNVPSCSGNPRTTTGATTTHGPASPPEFDCTGKENKNYPTADKCSNKFYSCDGGFTFVLYCPPGLWFDPDRDLCDHKDYVVACGGSTTHAPITSAPAELPPVKFVCHDKEDGYYANPDEKCSEIYFSCTGGFARELKCPDKLAFSISELRCELRDVAFECTGVMPTSTIAPPHVTFPTFAPVDFDCKGLKNGVYPDPKEKCSHKFYICSNGLAKEMHCADGTYYDVEEDRCEYKMWVPACGGSPPPKTTTTAPEATPPPEFDCLKLQDGVYPDPKSKCTDFFYVCSNGFTSKIHCPPGLWYDIDNKVCDGWGNIYACSGTSKVPTTTTTLLPGATTPLPAYDCTGKPDGFYPDPTTKCQNFFYVCTNGHTIQQNCPAGLWYDAKLETCELWLDVYDCAGKTRPPSTTRLTTTHLPEGPSPIKCEKDGDYPDPTKECSEIFYTCSNGIAFRRECPRGTFYDIELGVCDTWHSVPKCSGTPRPPSTTTALPSLTPPTPSPYDCSGKPPGNYPAGDCEQYFWTCVGSVAFKQLCPPGTVYDAEEDQCQFKSWLPKCGGSRPTHPPHETEITTPPVPLPVDCSKLPDGNVPDPNNKCSPIYYTCANGKGYEKSCVSGLVFSAIDNACDYKHKVEECGAHGPRPTKRLTVDIIKTIDISDNKKGEDGPQKIDINKDLAVSIQKS